MKLIRDGVVFKLDDKDTIECFKANGYVEVEEKKVAPEKVAPSVSLEETTVPETKVTQKKILKKK